MLLNIVQDRKLINYSYIFETDKSQRRMMQKEQVTEQEGSMIFIEVKKTMLYC